MSKISKLQMRTGLLKNFIKHIEHLTLKTFEPKWSNNRKIVLQTCCSGKTTTASFFIMFTKLRKLIHVV